MEQPFVVKFGKEDYHSIRDSILVKLESRDYFNGHIDGFTTSGYRYRLITTVIKYSTRFCVAPVWWEMYTFDKSGDKLMNDFSFSCIKW